MARGGQQGDPTDWVTRAADDAIRHAGGTDRVITCSSGASPSGPVHLGNLREFLTVHFVADELQRRGVSVRHLHVWDDYDRFRKVPAGVDPSWADHIGRPLSAVPDPWECHASWADHFKAPLRDALHELGVDMEEISQTERYTRGSTASRCCTPYAIATTSTRCSRSTAPRSAWPSRSRRRRSSPTPSSRTRTSTPRPAPGSSGSRSSRTAASAGATPPHHGVRRRDHRPLLHLPVVRVHRGHQPGHAERGQAGLEGRLADAVGLRIGRLRAGRHGPRHARLLLHRRPRAGRDRCSTCCGRPGSATASSGSPGCRRCRRPRAASRPRRTRCW